MDHLEGFKLPIDLEQEDLAFGSSASRPDHVSRYRVCCVSAQDNLLCGCGEVAWTNLTALAAATPNWEQNKVQE